MFRRGGRLKGVNVEQHFRVVERVQGSDWCDPEIEAVRVVTCKWVTLGYGLGQCLDETCIKELA